MMRTPGEVGQGGTWPVMWHYTPEEEEECSPGCELESRLDRLRKGGNFRGPHTAREAALCLEQTQPHSLKVPAPTLMYGGVAKPWSCRVLTAQ